MSSAFARILQQNSTFIAGEDLPAYRRVKINGQTASLADSTDIEVGIIAKEVQQGERITVELLQGGGVYGLHLDGSISSDATVYRADDGKVSATGDSAIGRAIKEGSNNGFCFTLIDRAVGGGVNGADVHGFLDYNNTSGDFNALANEWTTIPNNGAGAYTNLAFGPTGVPQLLDPSTGKLDYSHLKLGDSLFIRNDITVTPSVNGAAVEFRYELGEDPGGLYHLPRYWGTLNNGAGFATRFVEEDYIYMGDTNTLNSPTTLQIRVSEDSVINNAGCVILALIQ